MAGSNGTPKFEQVDRENEILNLKYRGIQYHNPNPLNPLSTSAALTGQQLLNDIWFSAATPNAVTGPTGAQMSLALEQSYLTTVPSTWQILMENSDPANAKVVTFPAPGGGLGGFVNYNGTSPATISIAPNSTAIVGFQVLQQSPLIVQVLYVLPSAGGGGGGGGPFPAGLLSEQVAAGGTATINGVTITSTDPDLVITNGNGVGGNPSITTAITVPASSTIPPGQIQNAFTYIGTILNSLNGVRWSNAASGHVVAAGIRYLLGGAGSTVIGDFGTDPGMAQGNPNVYTTGILPATNQYLVSLNFYFNAATATETTGDLQYGFQTAAGAPLIGLATPIVTPGGGGSFGQIITLASSTSYNWFVFNSDAATITLVGFELGIRRIQ